MSENNVQEFRLGEVLEIGTVRALHAELKAALQVKMPLVLDGSRVARIDTAVLQLLAALLSGPGSMHRSVSLRSPSTALTKAAALLGLAESFKNGNT